MKKGQITVYIILGIVILAVISLVLFARSIGVGIDPESFLKNSADDIKNEMSECLDTLGEEAVFTLTKQGGTLFPHKYRMYQGYNVNYLCTDIPNDFRCMNRMLTLNDIEKEIGKYVKDNLDNCFVVDPKYFDVEKGDKKIEVTVAENNVLISLDYPLILKKGSVVKKIGEVSKVVDVALGKLYNVANDIIEDEALYGDFDILTYMLVHRDIIIERDKPYPDKIYTITSDEDQFRFAVEGEIIEKD